MVTNYEKLSINKQNHIKINSHGNRPKTQTHLPKNSMTFIVVIVDWWLFNSIEIYPYFLLLIIRLCNRLVGEIKQLNCDAVDCCRLLFDYLFGEGQL